MYEFEKYFPYDIPRECQVDAIKFALDSFLNQDKKVVIIEKGSIVEKGNIVKFGPRDEDNFIECPKTGLKLPLKRNGTGSFLLIVDFLGGGRGEITVDSGAEESVCPVDWASQFGTNPVGTKMNFKGANGNTIEHYGQREIKCLCPF